MNTSKNTRETLMHYKSHLWLISSLFCNSVQSKRIICHGLDQILVGTEESCPTKSTAIFINRNAIFVNIKHQKYIMEALSPISLSLSLSLSLPSLSLSLSPLSLSLFLFQCRRPYLHPILFIPKLMGEFHKLNNLLFLLKVYKSVPV